MKILQASPQKNYQLFIVLDDGTKGNIDITPYLQYEAFEPLKNENEFLKVMNGGYYVEWECGVDLSIDTLCAKIILDPCAKS